MATNVGTAEYQSVGPQAAGRAACPWCNDWHSRATGKPIGAQGCNARYIRVRKVAICVRGKPLGFGATVRVPTINEIQTAVDHAAAG